MISVEIGRRERESGYLREEYCKQEEAKNKGPTWGTSKKLL